MEGTLYHNGEIGMLLQTSGSNDVSILCLDEQSGNYNQINGNRVLSKVDKVKALKTGILEVRQCKAVFEGEGESVITKYFKNKINLDEEEVVSLISQNLYLSEQEKRQECLNGDFAKCNGYKDIENLCMKGRSNACVHLLDNQYKYNIKCPSYLKITKKACDLKIGDACVLLGDEYHPISTRDYGGKWRRNYGRNCSLANERQAYALYKKACDLGSSAGCDRHNELDMIIMEIGERKDDKIRKYDYTIRHR